MLIVIISFKKNSLIKTEKERKVSLQQRCAQLLNISVTSCQLISDYLSINRFKL